MAATLERHDCDTEDIEVPAAEARRYGWPLGREVLVIIVGLAAYRAVRAIVKDEIPEATSNANWLIDFEKALGIFTEVDLQAGILNNEAIIWFLNRYYFFGHFVGALIAFVWLYTRHFSGYGPFRRVMVYTTFSALALHVAFPLAPPRWYPDLGFVDTLQTYGPKVYDSSTVTATANQIAAMPSLHVAWALIIAWAVLRASDWRYRWLVLAHPIGMTASVVLTANHWWLDVIAAMLLVALAIAADAPIQRWLARAIHQSLDGVS